MGININNAFPSNFLKASDLQGQNLRVKIDKVLMEDVGDDHKPIVYFVGKNKGLVLNKTNATVIAASYGDDTDGWIGGIVELFATKTLFQGKMVDALRVLVPNATSPSLAPKPQPKPVVDPKLNDDLSDIPF